MSRNKKWPSYTILPWSFFVNRIIFNFLLSGLYSTLFLHYTPTIFVYRFWFALFWEWYEHNSSAQGTVPSKLDRGAASAVRRSTRWVESELADHLTVRQVPVLYQWHSVGVRWTQWTDKSMKWSEILAVVKEMKVGGWLDGNILTV